MNVAVNIMQGPARALVADVVDAEYQQLGNAMVSCTMGTQRHHSFCSLDDSTRHRPSITMSVGGDAGAA